MCSRAVIVPCRNARGAEAAEFFPVVEKIHGQPLTHLPFLAGARKRARRSSEHVRFSLMSLVRQIRPLVLSESPESLSLADSYVASRVIPASSRDDARHIAIAALAGCEALVSWNFKHIVNLRRKRLVHSVNIRLGYPLIELVSPEEVLYE